MKKVLLMSLLAGLTIGLNACGEQKISQNVTIDKSLLEVLQGKASGGNTPTTKPSAGTASPEPGSSSTPSSPPRNTSGTGASANVGAEAELRAVIQANGTALNNQDLNAFAQTLHPQSKITQFMPDIFYLLVQAQTRYRFNSMTVEAQNENTATVYVDRSTTDISGTIEQGIVYSLQKSGPNWKIFFMEVDNSDDF